MTRIVGLNSRKSAGRLLAGIGLTLATAMQSQAEPPATGSPAPPQVIAASAELGVPAGHYDLAPGHAPMEPCPLYFRDRPRGGKKKKRAIMLNNRVGEPQWYRYYRCEHFGYHPTIWTPWPDNWLTCRPAPGKHPYDLVQPDPLPEELTPEPSRVRPRNSTDALTPPPERPGDIDIPRPLPRDDD